MIKNFKGNCVFCDEKMSCYFDNDSNITSDDSLFECFNPNCDTAFLCKLNGDDKVILFAFNVFISDDKVVRIFSNVENKTTLFAEKIKENDDVAPFEPAYIVYDDSDFIKFKSYEHARNIIMMRMVFK